MSQFLQQRPHFRFDGGIREILVVDIDKSQTNSPYLRRLIDKFLKGETVEPIGLPDPSPHEHPVDGMAAFALWDSHHHLHAIHRDRHPVAEAPFKLLACEGAPAEPERKLIDGVSLPVKSFHKSAVAETFPLVKC